MDGVVSVEYITELVLKRKWTHKRISELLKRRFPHIKGLSEMSVRRYCTQHNIHRSSRLTDGQLDVVVQNAVSKVGPTYGRKMLKGKLEAECIRVHDKRISKSLERVAPEYHKQRVQNTARLFNPVPYKADYFGHKIHLDQNEKLVMYWCTTVLAADGYSSFLLAVASMPVKNNLEIYKSVFRPILVEYGLWDQVRVDCGKEFYLVLFLQQALSPQRHNVLRAPYLQTPSTKNHMAERHWVELNSRINYPVKALLNKMVQDELLDMLDETVRFCVSWMTVHIVQAGVKELLPAWNHHEIPGKGKPVEIMERNNKAVRLEEVTISSPESALFQYERSGGHLKNFGTFGTDPLANCPQLQETRMSEFVSQYPSFDSIFNAVVNNDPITFRQSILMFISITDRLKLQL